MQAIRRTNLRAFFLSLLGCVLLVASVSAQWAINFKAPQYFTPDELKPGATNHLKSLLVGQQARLLSNSLAQVNEPWLGRFDIWGATNVAATSPGCFYDATRHTVFSTNVLHVFMGNGQMSLSGQGYLCDLTNFNLTISNRVRTLIRRDIAATARSNAPSLTTGIPQPGNKKTTALAATNQYVTIHADRAFFNYQSNQATYLGHVRVEDPPLEMFSDKLTVFGTSTGSVEKIVTEQNVILLNHQDSSRVTGDQGIYQVLPGREMLELTGRPARWKDPLREAEANHMFYDAKNRIMRLEDKARLRLPRTALNQSDWLLNRTATPRPAPAPAPATTNQSIIVQARQFDIELPATNRPARTFTARRDVVIFSEADQSRATGNEAVYREATGTLELLGNAAWQHQERLAKADRLFFDRTQQVFRATGSAYLKVPVSEYNKQIAVASGQPAQTVATNGPPHFIEVTSDRYVFQHGFLTFYDRVHAQLLQGGKPQGTLDCGWLSLKLSNQVERVEARYQINAEQFPMATDKGKMTTKKMNAERLVITVGTNGQVRHVLVQTNVFMRQAEVRPGLPQPSFSSLNADEVTADFYTHTNQVRELLATGNVHMTKDTNYACGQRAIYTATNDTVELTGNPSAKVDKVDIQKTDRIVWNRTLNSFYTGLPVGTVNPSTIRSNLPSTLSNLTNRPNRNLTATTNATNTTTAPAASRKARRTPTRLWQ